MSVGLSPVKISLTKGKAVSVTKSLTGSTQSKGFHHAYPGLEPSAVGATNIDPALDPMIPPPAAFILCFLDCVYVGLAVPP